MWHEHIDIYCERIDNSFLSEPINAITNLAFILASFYMIYKHKKDGLNQRSFILLSLLVSFIGVGSFLFHTFANKWSSLADTIPIWSFVILYILYVLRVVFEIKWIKTLRIMIIVFVLSYIGFTLANSEGSSQKILNGSLQYAPALFFMLVYTIILYTKKYQSYKYAMSAVIIFFISLLFRSIDISICENFIIGTHFIWHLLNALMLYFLLLTIHLSLKQKINKI